MNCDFLFFYTVFQTVFIVHFGTFCSSSMIFAFSCKTLKEIDTILYSVIFVNKVYHLYICLMMKNKKFLIKKISGARPRRWIWLETGTWWRFSSSITFACFFISYRRWSSTYNCSLFCNCVCDNWRTLYRVSFISLTFYSVLNNSFLCWHLNSQYCFALWNP